MTPGYWKLNRLIEKLNLSKHCKLVSYSHQQLQEVMRCGDYYISLTTTDGTPISILEAMANGVIPIMSNLRCHKEWIKHLENGFLLDISTAEEVTKGLMLSLKHNQKASLFAEKNFELLKERADWYKIMPEMEKFYNFIYER
ncbi:MAG: glycosyltransferase [Candidatus Aminicenantes bacterium]|nr:glycosyltransferase [Candidatus Aminicenantes bacterium]